MNDIRSLLRVVARRLELSAALQKVVTVCTIMAGLAVLLVMADRLPANPFVPWVVVIPVAAVLAAAIVIALWWPTRRSELQVAVAVDERLELREKLSTALHCHRRDDPFAQAAVDDAVRAARDRGTQERSRRLFKVAAPKLWWVPPVLLIGAYLLSLTQQWNAFKRERQDDPQAIEATAKVVEALDEIKNKIKGIEDPTGEFKDILDDLDREGADPLTPRSEDRVKREGIKQINDVKRRLDEMLNSERAKASGSLKRSLSKLKAPKSGPAKVLADALAKGDFKAASEALLELQRQADAGEMNKEQQDQLAKQLDDIAKQLQQLAQQQDQLEKALQQAGMNPQLAQNAQALQQAIQNNPNLNQQQKQQLQQMANAQQQAAQQCQGLQQAMQQMAQAMQNGQPMNQGAQQMQQQLGQAEMMQQMLMQAQAAANACQGQGQRLGQGLGLKQLQQGGGMGQRGQGAGGNAPIIKTPSKTKVEQTKTPVTSGDIIASQFFDGPQVKGESRAKLKQVIADAKEGFDESMTENVVHRRHQEAHQHYFGELEKRARVVEDSEPAPARGKDTEADDSPEETPSTSDPPDDSDEK